MLARYHAAIDRRDFGELSEMLAQDAVYISNGIASLKGRDAIISALQAHLREVEHRSPVQTRVEFATPREAQTRWHLEGVDRASNEAFTQSGTEKFWIDAEGLIILVSTTND